MSESDPTRPAPTLQSGADIGQALKAVREHRGLSIDELAETTRIRTSYLQALEDMRLEQLPSRPFTVGYIRAYAQALDLDPEAAVLRFRAEEPMLDEPLPEPIGVRDDRDPRLTLIFMGVCIIVAAIVLWNLAQRGLHASAPPPPKASDRAAARALESVKSGPVALGPPLPAPVESTTPPPYQTPGLDKADAEGVNPSPPSVLGVRVEGEPPAVDPATLPPTFTPAGKVYGAAPNEPSPVTLQALKSAALIVRGLDGSVYFARQLSKGDAWRAPRIAGLTVDVSDADHFQVFVGGQSRGLLPAPQSSLDKLGQAAGGAPPRPRPPATGAPAAAAQPQAAPPPQPRP